MVEKVPMTALGYAALEDELKKRQSVERPRIIEHIAEARSHGDLSENAARQEQGHMRGSDGARPRLGVRAHRGRVAIVTVGAVRRWRRVESGMRQFGLMVTLLTISAFAASAALAAEIELPPRQPPEY